jgi:hypothetical protein
MSIPAVECTGWILGAVYPGLKHPDLEADSSTPAGVEMKNILFLYLHLSICLDGMMLN